MPMPAHRPREETSLAPRSLLFVPADRADRFDKAASCGADGIILDLEDSVAESRKPDARTLLRDYLAMPRQTRRFVRINPLERQMLRQDLEAARGADALVLPKATSAKDVVALVAAWGHGCPPILPIATETPVAIFALGTYAAVADSICGLTWGAEDLSAAVGATTARDERGKLTAPYELARSLALFAAHAANVAAIETVYPAISDVSGLTDYAQAAARDGFSGMLAIHPAQVAVINSAFTPTDAQVLKAREVVAAFAKADGTGVVRLNGQMLDAPHLKQAHALLARSVPRGPMPYGKASESTSGQTHDPVNSEV